jgi:hypothetical protein
VHLKFACSGQEINHELARHGSNAYIPVRRDWGVNPNNALNKVWSLERITFTAAYVAKPSNNYEWRSSWPSVDFVPNNDQEQTSLNVRVQPNKIDFLVETAARNDTIVHIMGQCLKNSLYSFDALRTVASTCAFGRSTKLHSNASNLAEVLNMLASNPSAYRDYVTLVNRVLPTVKYVTVVAKDGPALEIRILNSDESTRREDLTVPLEDCGTGVGQVLALLYVVSQTASSIIIIDEPNSFLHPGAAKTLIRIFREHREHQFVISTHSPEIIVAAEAEKLFMLRVENEETKIEEVQQTGPYY